MAQTDFFTFFKNPTRPNGYAHLIRNNQYDFACAQSYAKPMNSKRSEEFVCFDQTF